jgi:hypothetical protein
MKKMRTWGAFVILLFLSSTVGHSQPTPPVKFGGPLFYAFPLLTQYPPLNTGMPFNVLIGYIGGDSIVRNAPESLIRDVTKNLTYADTAKYAAKYMYELDDYDPVTFFRWCYTQPTAGMYPSGGPGFVKGRALARMVKIFPPNLNAYPLLYSDYIAHIKVTQTVATTDSTASFAKTVVLVTSYILDTVKGKRVPFCLNEQFRAKEEGRTMQSALGACLNWDYALEWKRLNHSPDKSHDDSSFVDGEGNQWIQESKEYIVFLRYESLRRYDTYNYADLFPVTGWGSCGGMYPIIDGRVYDPYNDFGYGSNLTVEQFEAALRNNIYSITHQ